MLDRMVVFPVGKEEEREHDARESRKPIDVHDECFVRAPELFLEDVEQ